jgi:hypothetical protein
MLWVVRFSYALHAAAAAAAAAIIQSHAAATSIPMFIALSTKSLAACWLVQAATLTLAGCAAGMLPAICCSLYPAGVRVTGVCLGFHLGEKVVPLVWVAGVGWQSVWRLGGLHVGAPSVPCQCPAGARFMAICLGFHLGEEQLTI